MLFHGRRRSLLSTDDLLCRSGQPDPFSNRSPVRTRYRVHRAPVCVPPRSTPLEVNLPTLCIVALTHASSGIIALLLSPLSPPSPSLTTYTSRPVGPMLQSVLPSAINGRLDDGRKKRGSTRQLGFKTGGVCVLPGLGPKTRHVGLRKSRSRDNREAPINSPSGTRPLIRVDAAMKRERFCQPIFNATWMEAVLMESSRTNCCALYKYIGVHPEQCRGKPRR